MKRDDAPTLQQRFLKECADRVMSTKEVFDWYCKARAPSTKLPDRSIVHRLLLDPLLYQGLVTKLERGLYAIDPPAEALRLAEQLVSAEDEWEKYVQAKLS